MGSLLEKKKEIIKIDVSKLKPVNIEKFVCGTPVETKMKQNPFFSSVFKEKDIEINFPDYIEKLTNMYRGYSLSLFSLDELNFKVGHLKFDNKTLLVFDLKKITVDLLPFVYHDLIDIINHGSFTILEGVDTTLVIVIVTEPKNLRVLITSKEQKQKMGLLDEKLSSYILRLNELNFGFIKTSYSSFYFMSFCNLYSTVYLERYDYTNEFFLTTLELNHVEFSTHVVSMIEAMHRYESLLMQEDKIIKFQTFVIKEISSKKLFQNIDFLFKNLMNYNKVFVLVFDFKSLGRSFEDKECIWSVISEVLIKRKLLKGSYITFSLNYNYTDLIHFTKGYFKQDIKLKMYNTVKLDFNGGNQVFFKYENFEKLFAFLLTTYSKTSSCKKLKKKKSILLNIFSFQKNGEIVEMSS